MNQVSFEPLIRIYILFICEEMAQGIIGLKVGSKKLSLQKYLLGASLITTVNLGTLFLIILGKRVGLYMGLFRCLFMV